MIPHPEQFWPILLTGYDVDGVEVWNPQSHRYTNFLVSVLNEKNRRMDSSERPLLIFMGDDTHMSEKPVIPVNSIRKNLQGKSDCSPHGMIWASAKP